MIDEIARHNLRGRLLGLDVGDKRIGVSISDVSQLIATGVSVINRTSLVRDKAEIKKIIDGYNPIAIIFGWPVQPNGLPGLQCEKNQLLIEKIKEIFNGSIIPWDERFSSKVTEQVLIQADMSRSKRSKIIDKVAATYILQSALDFINYRRQFLGVRNGL